jgi:diketogulonate reductase-like aldo/keto reductase
MPSTSVHFTLNNWVKIPAIGFGTFAGEDFDPGAPYKAVKKALDVGYRHIDTGWFYKNEEEVGQAIQDFLKDNPNVKRSDIFVTTKLWAHLVEPEDVRWSLNDSLKKLQLDYADLFLIHWPFAIEKVDNNTPKEDANGRYIIRRDWMDDRRPTWKAMEELYHEGKCRAIGVSNFLQSQLEDMLSWATVKPTVNQVELHPFLAQEDLVKFCLDNDILPEAYSPLGSQNQTNIMPSANWSQPGEKVTDNKTLNEVAKRSGNTLAQVLVAWGVKRGYVVLPKSATPSRIESNLKDIDLSDNDFEAVNEVSRNRRYRFINMKHEYGIDLWPEDSARQGT